MVSLILVIVVLAVIVVAWFKLKETGHKTKFIGLLVIIVLLLGTVAYVWLETKPNLATYDGFVSLGKSYFAWVGGMFKNLGHVTTYVVKQDWGLNKTTEGG